MGYVARVPEGAVTGCLRPGESQADKERELSTLRNMIKGALALGVALLVGAAAAGAAAASVSNPAVEGPIEKGIRGHAWNHSVFPLSTASYSYTENEYFYSG